MQIPSFSIIQGFSSREKSLHLCNSGLVVRACGLTQHRTTTTFRALLAFPWRSCTLWHLTIVREPCWSTSHMRWPLRCDGWMFGLCNYKVIPLLAKIKLQGTISCSLAQLFLFFVQSFSFKKKKPWMPALPAWLRYLLGSRTVKLRHESIQGGK